jgi:adenylate cyclase
MAEENVKRKLAAILYADVVGYSRLTGADEEGTHKTVAEYLDAIAEMVSGHDGRVVHYAGDAVLADFGSVVAAVKCAVAVQKDLTTRNVDIPDDRKVQFRIGVNLGA